MPAHARNPALFPAFVAQQQFPGIVLPAALARAVRKRQTEFLAGRYCAREALRACAPEHAEAAIAVGERRESVWPHGVVGSITHAHRFASVAATRSSRSAAGTACSPPRTRTRSGPAPARAA